MKKAIFIYNPLSGDRGVASKLDSIIERFNGEKIIIHLFRLLSLDENILLNQLKENSYDFAVVSGGDGTLNSIVNLFLLNSIELPIGIIPAGTCNDFARCINLPANLNDCLDVILSGNIKAVDVGLVDENKYFLSTCAGGLFVDAAFNTDNELKKNFGPLAYYLKALTEIVNIKPFTIKVMVKSKVYEEKALLFLILNGKHAAGFTNIIDEADVCDGIMDIVIIKDCSHIDLAGIFFRVLSSDYLNDDNIVKIRASDCMLESDSQISLSIDGEKAINLPKRIRFINKKLKVFMPIINTKTNKLSDCNFEAKVENWMSDGNKFNQNF